MARKLSGPIAIMEDSPIAESTEYRPPTQSHVTNIFAVSMPNFATSSAFVETATKCFATDFSSLPKLACNQSRADLGVRHRFHRCKRLGADNEKRLGGIEIPHCFPKLGAIDV